MKSEFWINIDNEFHYLDLYMLFFCAHYEERGGMGWMPTFEEFKKNGMDISVEYFLLHPNRRITKSKNKFDSSKSFAFRIYREWKNIRFYEGDIEDWGGNILANFEPEDLKYTALHARDSLNDEMRERKQEYDR